MPYNFVADSFHTMKLCSRLSSSEVRFYTENGCFVFLSPLFGGLRGNVRYSSWAHLKALQRGQLDPKFQGEGVTPNQSFCHKTRMNYLLCGIRMWAQLSFVLSQITHLTDRQTDGQMDSFLVA